LRPHRGSSHDDVSRLAGQFAGRAFTAIDAHTEGMPERVITDGVGVVPGATMLERKLRFEAEMDDLRLLLMREPRGHGAMSGSILQPPTRPDADWGVIFIEVAGCLPMCGHGTMGIATVLVEQGMVAVREPETVVRLETPAGLVEARVAVEDGRARSVTLRNVVAFLHARDVELDVAGLGPVTCDLAFGGNFFAIADAAALGLRVDADAGARLVDAGLAIIDAVEASARPVHPEDPRIAGCHHVVFTAPGATGADARNATAIHPGYLDRSPCGTGTCARMAQLHARGALAAGVPFVNESPIGSRFTGRIVGETTVAGRPAVVPEITGRAWITGRAEYLLAPDDPFPAGFAL
jgi:proline racemase